MASGISTRLAAAWRRALAVSAHRPGFIGTILYVLLIRLAVILAILVRVALISQRTTAGRVYAGIVLLSAAGLAVAVLDFRSKAFRRPGAGSIVTEGLDIAVISCLYALSGDPRSDTVVLFALPLLVAADEFSFPSAVFALILVLASFGIVLHASLPSGDQLRQFLGVFVPRSVFLTMLMAAWASAVRSLRIKERQLTALTWFNDELSELKTADEITKAVCHRAMDLTGADSAEVLKPLGESGPWPLSDPFLRSLIGTGADDAALRELLEKSEREVAVAGLSRSNPSGHRSVLATPIASHGHLFGIVLLASRSRHGLQAGWIESISRALADQTATALDRAQVLASWRMLLDALSELAQSMPAAQLLLNADLDLLLNEVTGPLKFTYATVSIVDEYRDSVEMIRGVNVPPGWIRRSHYTMQSNDIFAYIARTQDTVEMRGWDDRFNRDMYERFEHHKLARVFCPIVSRRRTIGVMEAGVPLDMRSKVLTGDSVDRVKRLCIDYGESIESHLPQSILKQIAALGARIVGADAAGVDVHRGDGDLLCAGAGAATPEFMRHNREVFEQIRGEAMSSTQPQVFDDARGLQERFPDLYRQGIQSLAMFQVTLPVHHISWVLWVAFWRPHRFHETELEIESILLRQIEVVVQNYFELTGSSKAAERTWSLSRLQTVIQSVAARFQLRDLLTRIAQDLMHTLDADVVVIHQYLKDQDQFEIPPVTRGTLMFPDSLGKPHRSSILWRFVGLPESVFESDVRQNLLFLDTVPGGFAVREEIASAAVLILRTVEPDEVVGLVFVNYRTKREFQDEDIQAMNALASSAAIAIRTARERERAQRSVTRLERELAAVGAAPKAILAGRGTMSPQTVLDLLLKEAVEITAAEAGVVLWRHRSEFEVRSETPLRGLSKNLRIAGTDEIIKTILTARRTVVFSDVTSARAASTRPIVSAAVRSQLLAPMFDNDVLLGVIVLEHSSIAKFSEEDRRFLDALTVQGLIVLNAIDMYDQLQRQIMPQRALTTIATRIQDTSQSLDTALRLLLTGVTAEPGIAFSRAMLLTFDEAGTELRGRLASGALTREAAEYSWKNIERKLQGVAPENALSALLDEAEQAGREAPGRRPIDPLTDRVQRITFKADSLLGAMGAAIRSGRPQQVASDQADPWRALLADTSPYTFACCPLVWQEEKLGVLVVDDRFLPRERARIEESRLVNLVSFADMISLVILNAKLRDRSQAEAFRDLEHQLRSPLHTASAIVNDLATAPEGEFRKKCETLQRVLAKARRVSGSIRLYAESAGNQSIHLRDLVRLRAKMVSDMLGDAIHEGELQRDDLLLSVDGLSLAAFESVAVEFDRILLEQVFGNIFDNVFKYAAQGTEVRVRAGQSEGGVTLAIENVAFLTEDEAQRSMERGFRGDVAEEVTGEGSGLGLWIVDHIMQAHSGSARLRVEDGNRVITELFFREVVSDAHRNR